MLIPSQCLFRSRRGIKPFLYGLGLLYLVWLALPSAHAGGAVAAGQTFLWLAILLVAARLAVLVEHVGMPAVLGELLVGVLLGNLSLAGVTVFEQIETDPIIFVLAELGVVILLFQIGLETNLKDMRRVGARALAVAALGVVAPFLLGAYVVGPWLLPGLGLHAYLFIGATLTATSVGITGRVLRDLGQLEAVEARIILGAAVIDDVLGLIVLAVVSSLVSEGQISAVAVGGIVLQAVAFLVGSIVAGRLVAPHLARLLSRISAGVAMQVSLVLAIGLFMAWFAHHIGLAAIVGAFAAGLLLEPVFLRDFDKPEIDGEIRPLLAGIEPAAAAKIGAVLDHHAKHHHQALIEPLGHVFVPVFFVFTGMQVRLEALLDPKVVLVALAITVAAVAGKLVAGLAAGPVRKWVVGWGMVPRGEVGLIFAVVGRQLGVLDEQVFSVMLVMVMLTTLVTPPVLGRLLRK
jgi:Kef-type K+ transport system membrane component KefB